MPRGAAEQEGEKKAGQAQEMRESTHRVGRVLLVFGNHRVVGQTVDECRSLLRVTTHPDDNATRPVGDSGEKIEEGDLDEGPIVRQVSSPCSPRQENIWAYAFFPTIEHEDRS